MERANAESLKNRLEVLAELYTCDMVHLNSDYIGTGSRSKFEMLCQVFDKGFTDTTNFYYYMADVQALQRAEELLRSGAVKHNYPLGEQLSEKVARTREMLEKYPQGKYAEVGKMRKEALIRETGCKPEKSDFGSLIKGLYAASVCYTDICAGTKDQFDHNDNNYLYLIRFMTEHRLMSDKLFNADLSTINEYGLGNAFARDTKRYIINKQRELEKEDKRRKNMQAKNITVEGYSVAKLAVESKEGTIKTLTTVQFIIPGLSTKDFLRSLKKSRFQKSK